MRGQDMTPQSWWRSDAPLTRPFAALQREFDRMFEDFLPGLARAGNGGETALVPKLDIGETDKAYELHVEVPGVAEKDVEVSVAGNILTIRGEKKAETETKDKNMLRVERSYGSFYRAMTLPPDADVDKIAATSKDGVLRISIPKATSGEAKPKKVEIRKG